MENEKKYLTPTTVGDEDITVGKPYEVIREEVENMRNTVYHIVDDRKEVIQVVIAPYEESPIAKLFNLDISSRYDWKFCHKDGTLI